MDHLSLIRLFFELKKKFDELYEDRKKLITGEIKFVKDPDSNRVWSDPMMVNRKLNLIKRDLLSVQAKLAT